jgi:hypothetical protein
VEEEPALLLAQASIKLSPAALTAAALVHLDEPRAHALLGDGSSNDKTDGWCLDIGATHHMTGRREFFTELDSDVRGSIKFGDAFGVEIKGVDSVIFAAVSVEHRLLTGVYYIPVLRNSIISLGQLDVNGSHVEIKDKVMRIWDHHRRLLAKVTRGTNRLYVLNVQVAQPICLAARRMRVFSATTQHRTARSRTTSSSGATRRLWGWLGPSSSRGECLLSFRERRW